MIETIGSNLANDWKDQKKKIETIGKINANKASNLGTQTTFFFEPKQQTVSEIIYIGIKCANDFLIIFYFIYIQKIN